MRNKFVLIDNIIKDFDIFLISESMLDHTFTSFIFQHLKNLGEIEIEHPKFPNLELNLVFELHQSKRKWLFTAYTNHHFKMILSF